MPYKNAQLESNHEETSNKPKLQNSCPVYFKYSKVKKDRERLKNCSRLKERKETQLINAKNDTFAIKNIFRSTGETEIKSVDQIIQYQC